MLPHGAMSGEKPRAGPPLCATARKPRSGSREANAQSEKLGGLTTKPLMRVPSFEMSGRSPVPIPGHAGTRLCGSTA